MLTLRQFVDELRTKFPADKPVKVRCCKMPYGDRKKKQNRDYGDCRDQETYYLIRLNKNLSLEQKKDTLLHEWAHCIAGWEDDKSPHSDKWGRMYAKIYREMVDT